MISTLTQFTSEQRAAIDARSVSVALSAGAGCGKTFVLTERFLSHLEPSDPHAPPLKLFASAELHELIAITFTDRAAREMRDRIRQKCYDRLKHAPAEQTDYWLRLLRNLDAARVSTIHAFCGALLRAHAVEAGLDPRFVVIEQSQADTLLAELIEDVLREKLSDREDPLYEPLLNLTALFGLKRLQAMVAALLWSGRSAEFESWLARTPLEVTTIWDGFRRDTVVPGVLREVANSASARGLLDVIGQLGDAGGELRKRCAALSQLLPGLPTSRNPAADLDAIIENARVQGAGSKKTWPDETLYERFKTAAEKLRTAAKHAATFLEFDAAAAQPDAQAGLQLLGLAHAVLQRYNQRKRELAWVDFNDLLTRARQLLTDPAHAELQQRLASQVRLLLVDECQDTDPLQVELIKALCGQQAHDGKLFIVGDYKQSIYRFRGADPGVFRRLEQETPPAGHLPLSQNFRSQSAILDFVNALFCDALSSRADARSADDNSTLQYQPLIPQREQITPTPAVEFLWATVEEMKKSDAGAKDFARQREAEFIARRICGMLDRKEELAGEKQPSEKWIPRPVQQKDIAILFRTLSNVQFYEEALRKYGIDYYLVGGHAFYAQQEIHDVVNLLRTLASPADTISLAGVLRSPMFALTDETLFWLAQHSQGLAAGLFGERMPDELSDEDRRRAQFAAATLRHLRDRKDRLSITALLNEALALTGYDAALLAEFMGERKLANLRKLLEQARVFDQSGVFGLADFIVQLSEFVAQLPREPLAATHPEGTDVVRLMTIHQSKGLEFPVVFVPDVNRPARGNDQDAVWHPQLGPLVKLPARGEKTASISGLDLYKQLNDVEDQAERIRLLYVATTRAADYLVLSSGMFDSDIESPSAPWTKLLAERFNLRTGEFVTALPKNKAYHPPAVKVTTVPPPTDVPASTSHFWKSLDEAIHRALELAERQTKQLGGPQAGIWANGDGFHRLAEPVAVDSAARRRFSVSRLSGQLQSIEEVSTPALLFADEDQNDNRIVAAAAGPDLGILVHQVLARIDFFELVGSVQSDKRENIRAIIERCLEGYDAHSAKLVETAAELIERFLQSSRAREMAKVKTVRRELEFLLAWPPQESMPPPTAEQGRYLQGFIDCLYQDAAGQWHLVDYKTNQVSAAAVASLAPQFELQLGVYALAVEQILRRPPVELTVHFLRPAAEHQFDWDDALRSSIIKRVNQAIETTVMQK